MANRKIFASGSVDVIDDEWPFDATRCAYRINGEAVVGEQQPSALISWSDCCGGEVRVELDLQAMALSSGDIKVLGQARLYEGTSCNTQDLEDKKDIDFLVPANKMTQFNLQLESQGPGGGDKADIKINFANFPA